MVFKRLFIICIISIFTPFLFEISAIAVELDQIPELKNQKIKYQKCTLSFNTLHTKIDMKTFPRQKTSNVVIPHSVTILTRGNGIKEFYTYDEIHSGHITYEATMELSYYRSTFGRKIKSGEIFSLSVFIENGQFYASAKSQYFDGPNFYWGIDPTYQYDQVRDYPVQWNCDGEHDLDKEIEQIKSIQTQKRADKSRQDSIQATRPFYWKRETDEQSIQRTGCPGHRRWYKVYED